MGPAPLGPTWVSPLEKRLVYKSMRKPEELPLLAAGGQTEKERRKKTEEEKREGRSEQQAFFSTNPSTRFFSKYIQAIHFFHPPFLKFYPRHTQREKREIAKRERSTTFHGPLSPLCLYRRSSSSPLPSASSQDWVRIASLRFFFFFFF